MFDNFNHFTENRCSSCTHEKVCKLSKEYQDQVAAIRKVADPLLDRFKISVLCPNFSEIQFTVR